MVSHQSIQSKILSTLRENVARDKHPLAIHLNGFTDYQCFLKIFYNYRGGKTPHGIRLTWLGFQLVSSYFKPYDVELHEDYNKIRPLDLLYLDSCAKMPYYIGQDMETNSGLKLFVFESKLAIMLKLADGLISNLRTLGS